MHPQGAGRATARDGPTRAVRRHDDKQGALPAHGRSRSARAPPRLRTSRRHSTPAPAHAQDAYQAWELEARAAQPPPPLRAAVPFDGRTTSRDAFRGWQLPPSFAPIGLELAGDMMHALVPRGAPLPFTGKHIFSTVHDDQTELCILILSGDSTRASECELLGQFDLSGVPRGAARSPQIEVRSCLRAVTPRTPLAAFLA